MEPRRGMPFSLFVLYMASVIALRRKKRGGKSRRAGPTARRDAIKINDLNGYVQKDRFPRLAFVVDPILGRCRLPAAIVVRHARPSAPLLDPLAAATVAPMSRDCHGFAVYAARCRPGYLRMPRPCCPQQAPCHASQTGNKIKRVMTSL